jgi:hypothetical protein
MARNLWEAMREVWPLPAAREIKNTGPEWILQALMQATEQVRMMMMMTWWRIWHVRNEVVHHKPAPPIEVSRRFLSSYVDSLLCIKQYPYADPTKGKVVVQYDHMMPGKVKKQALKCKQVCPTKWSRPCPGWTKLNVDGSWVSEDVPGGAGMILRDDQG